MMETNSASVIIDGKNTNIVLNVYRNRIFIIATQYDKFGSMISVNKESNVRDFSNQSETYSIKTVFGKDDLESHVAARYIAENTNIDRPLLLSISLKDYDPNTLAIVTKAINKLKSW